jgi:hypothetical protein
LYVCFTISTQPERNVEFLSEAETQVNLVYFDADDGSVIESNPHDLWFCHEGVLYKENALLGMNLAAKDSEGDTYSCTYVDAPFEELFQGNGKTEA